MRTRTIMMAGLVLALVAPASLRAQVTGNITATATVNSVFTTGATQNLSFNAVNPGAGVTLDPAAGTGGTAGYVEFGYNADYRVTATTLPTDLTDGTTTIPVTWVCGTSGATGTPPGSVAACAQGTVVDSDNAVAGPGTVVVWLGGSIAAGDTNVLAGTYQGNIVFTIAAF